MSIPVVPVLYAFVYVRGKAWVVTCRRHYPTVHQTAVWQHVVSPALCHTLQPLGRSSGPWAKSRKHKLALVIRQFNTLLFQFVKMGGLVKETVR